MKKQLLKNLKDDHGVSFAETAISLFLLSLMMITLFRLTTTLIPAFKDDLKRGSELNKELLLIEAFNHFLSQVSPPWWLTEYSPKESGESWAFPWYGGEENKTLLIQIDSKDIQFILDDVILLKISRLEEIKFRWCKIEGRYYFIGETPVRTLYFPLKNGVIGTQGN
jgi:hypothetical protein